MFSPEAQRMLKTDKPVRTATCQSISKVLGEHFKGEIKAFKEIQHQPPHYLTLGKVEQEKLQISTFKDTTRQILVQTATHYNTSFLAVFKSPKKPQILSPRRCINS